MFILNSLISHAGADVKKTNFFSAAGKHIYFNRTRASANILYGVTTSLVDLYTDLIFFLFKVSWYEARDWCVKRGMQLASLKTLSQWKQWQKN